MLGGLVIFVFVWLVAGVISMPIGMMSRYIMHSPKGMTQDFVKDDQGNIVTVDYGAKAYLMWILPGPYGLWVSLGTLAASLYEYSHGTNYPGIHTLKYWKGDLDMCHICGPFALLVEIPGATYS